MAPQSPMAISRALFSIREIEHCGNTRHVVVFRSPEFDDVLSPLFGEPLAATNWAMSITKAIAGVIARDREEQRRLFVESLCGASSRETRSALVTLPDAGANDIDTAKEG